MEIFLFRQLEIFQETYRDLSVSNNYTLELLNIANETNLYLDIKVIFWVV
jgi:hypothetical protein